MNSLVVRAAAPVALMALIFYLSAQQSVGPSQPLLRDAGHFSQYALLAALWAWALAPALGRRALLAAAAISMAYALSDEIHQSFVPGRDADPLDVVIDWCGIAVALAVLTGWRRARSRRTARRARARPA